MTSRRDQFRLTPEHHAQRLKGIGGSDANALLNGDEGKILQIWREKRGEALPPDLSDQLYVCMGVATEDLNKYWFELQTGKDVSLDGEHIVHEEIPYMMCSLDGFVLEDDAVFEAKHVSGFEPFDKVAKRYMPQMYHNAYVAGVDSVHFSVLIATNKYEHCLVKIDDQEYMDRLLEIEKYFWDCVQSGTPPVVEPVEPPTIAVSTMRMVDMTGNNHWASVADEWLTTKPLAEAHARLAKELKAMVEPDVRQASGHGVRISRDKANKLRLHALK